MDKFYVKPKRSLKPSAAVSGTVISRNSPDGYPLNVVARASGVGKIYSRIRHTIEDNLTPKISGRLYKAGKHSKSMTALSSMDSSVGKYTLTSKSSGCTAPKVIAKDDRCTNIKISYAECDNTSAISSYFKQNAACSYVDSDEDEAQLSLNLVKTSLEDEIFEELEKVAHDENKLNAVLKSFDKIIFDYNDPLPQTKSSDSAPDQMRPLAAAATVTEDPKQTNTAAISVENVSDKATVIDASDSIRRPQLTDQRQTDCRHQFESTKLEKSSSSLSLTRRKCYQSPDSPCLRQMRHMFVLQQQQRQKSKSVWELSNSTKIPILKTMPLQKRSKSFCYQNTPHSPKKAEAETETRAVVSVDVNGNMERKEMPLSKAISTPRRMSRAVKYVNIKPPSSTSGLKSNADSSTQTGAGGLGGTVGLRQEAKTKNGHLHANQPRRTHSNANLVVKTRTSSYAPPTPPRRSRTSDELLDKCLEKGQQILRKVESLNTQRSPTTTPGHKKTVVRVKSNASNKTSRDNLTLRRKKFQHKLNYANENKILPPSLESCKIIPPDFAETAKKHAELLVNVVQLANATRSTPQRQMSADSGIANIYNSLDFGAPNAPLAAATKNHDSDSDDSGHISNENMEITINHQPSNSSSTASLIAPTASEPSESGPDLVRTPHLQRVCTTCRIAQVESVKVIRTHVEIYPNFTKEILFRSGVLSELEAKRDELLSDRIIQLQAYCRGYLARRSMAQRRVQELAVRCIQRNVKAFLAVRDWPWWRLLVRVTPLLNVHRTEEQLKSANEELLALRTKLERIENDRNELKTDNQKLEAKIISKAPMSPLHNEIVVVSEEPNGPSGNKMSASTFQDTISQTPNVSETLDTPHTNNNINSSRSTQNNEHNTENSKFLERVYLAMRSSKSRQTTPTPTSAKVYAEMGNSPEQFNSPDPSIPLCNDASYTSMSSINTNASSIMSPPPSPSPRPPKPPQDPNRLRKQMRLVPKQRERSPALKSTNSNGSYSSSTNYDSDDGLKTSKSRNGYANNSKAVGGVIDGDISTASVAPLDVKLTLPLPKIDTTASRSAHSNTLLNGFSSTRSSSDRLSLLTRSPSPSLSVRSTSSRASSICSSVAPSTRSSFSRLQTPPRRVFPQTYVGCDPLDAYEMRHLEQSPVIFDGNMSFVLGCKKQPVRQSFRPSPSFEDPRTASAVLSEKIQNFLQRTDHVQEEWTAYGRRSRGRSNTSGATSSSRATPTNSLYDDAYDTISLIERQRERNSMERCPSVGRTKSSQNILTKAFQISKTLPRTSTSRSNSMARDFSDTDDDRTIHEEDDNDLDELSEMAVDLAEERSAGNMATERLEGETAERLRLEKELSEKENKVKKLQESTEKLEMELICAKSDLNGISEEEDIENDEGGSSGGVYKLKYERVAKELEFTKRRLQTQHEHDLEQLIGLKKQLEKKLSDAYEEVEEQRQVVGQWKRKAQKMTNEMNDLRMLLEEQNARNNLLEKKQRKFDSECQALQDTARQERQTKDRLSREKDILIAEKFTLEQSLADTRLELDLKEEKLASLQRELDEMTFGGGTEEEIAQLRRSKNELDRRVKEQEEELDEMAGQVQLLEQAKLRLEMTLETMRKEARREAQQRDEELEEARGCAYKKIKALECQLETEHEERTLLLREKHELERRLSSMEDQDRVDRQAEETANQKLRRDLRKYKALLKDAHAQLERLKADTPGKTLIRQLRNQLEDAESARTVAMKARQTAEADLAEVQVMYEESNRARNEAEDRATSSQRDRGELQAQIEENEEELAELMKKYSATVKQLNTEQIAASEYEFKLSELEAERNSLKEQVAELQHRLENVENLADPSAAMMSKRLELRTKELESRLDLEHATRSRLEVQVNRHKEALERLQNEVSQSKVREVQAQEALKKSQKSLRELREEFHAVSGKEQESITKRKDLEKKVEQVESEASALKNDLRLALQRIADLQQAMEEGDEDLSDSEESRSSDASISDLEERLKPIQTRRQSLQKHNGGTTVSTTTTLVREKSENSPRITLTSPSSPHIRKLTLLASKLPGDAPKKSSLSMAKDFLKIPT